MATFMSGTQTLRVAWSSIASLLQSSMCPLTSASRTTLTFCRLQKVQRSVVSAASFHCTSKCQFYRNTEFEDEKPKKIGKVNLLPPNWLKYNDVVYPPTKSGEPDRPAEICHSRFQIKYSTKKMWYLAQMIRGMTIDEAIKQLAFHKRKGAAHIKETLEEAQEIAVAEHNVEFKSNLWICDSFVTKGLVVKGLRRHARQRYGIIHYRYTNFFVRLREGKPPEDYYPPEKTGHDIMADYIKKQRARRILYGM